MPKNSSKPRVLITGASGLIGGLAIEHLSDKYQFSNLSRRKVEGIRSTEASITDRDAIRPAFEDIDMVLHLAAFVDDISDWDGTLDVTVKGTINVFRAAQEAGIWRLVNMSTGSTMCGWEWYEGSPYGKLAAGQYDEVEQPWPQLDYTNAVRPDSPYGAAKAFTEAAARWFSDAHGMSMLNIRLGAVLDTNEPKLLRHFPGYLDQMDAVRMIDACLSAPESVKFDIFDAISDNSTRWRDTSHAEKVIGWKAQGSSDRFDPNDFRHQPGPPLPAR
jgi:nucleoside-diphosphate-sugar epimerase